MLIFGQYSCPKEKWVLSIVSNTRNLFIPPGEFISFFFFFTREDCVPCVPTPARWLLEAVS